MPGNSFNNRELAKRAGQSKGKHEKTKQWERLGELITGELTERVIDYLDSLPPDDMFKNYLLLLNYFKPQLSRSEVKDISDPVEKTIHITIGTDQIDLEK
jgi:hypothetical protein